MIKVRVSLILGSSELTVTLKDPKLALFNLINYKTEDETTI